MGKHYYDNSKPVNVFRNSVKLAGWTKQQQTGNTLTFNDTYNDVADVHISGNTVTEFEPAPATSPTFTRTSDAYKQDGSVVAAGVPRLETDGVMVEEGTVNLIPTNQQKFIGWAIGDNATIALTQNQLVPEWGATDATRILATAGDGTMTRKYLIATGNTTSGEVFSRSIYIKNIGANSVTMAGAWGEIIGTVAVGESKKLEYAYTAPSAANRQIQMRSDVATNGFDIIAWRPQIEVKPYATSFHPTTRSGESLAIPANVLSAAAFTLEIDQLFSVFATDVPVFNQFIDWSNYFIAGIRADTKRFRVKIVSAGVAYTTESAVLTIPTTQKTRISLSYDGVKYRGYVAGVKVLEWESSLNILSTPMTINKLSDFYSPNAIFGNLRISSIARSDAELANTGPLAVDEFTTYFADFNGDLDATKRHWTTYDSAGTLTVSDNASQSQQFTLPVLRKIGDVADEYDLGTGIVTRNIGVQSCDAGSSWTIAGTIANSLVVTNDGEYTLSGTTLTTSVPMVNSFEVLYQLATPVTEELGANIVPTYYPTTLVDTGQDNVAVSTIEVEAKVMDI